MKANRAFGILKAIAFSAVVFFVSCCNYPPTVKTVSANVTGDITITATGSVTSNGGEDVVSYGICLSATNSLPTISDTKKEGNSNAGNSASNFTVSFPGLAANAIYYFRAYAINSEGVAYGEAITVKTSVAPDVKNVSASLVTLSEATLNATINPNNTNTENWFEFGIVGETPQKVTVNNSTGGNDETISIKVSNLTPGKTYSFVAYAKNEYGETSSEAVTFETYIAVDYDGNYYHGVVIGTQTWLKENLKTTHYLNGDPIPNLQDTTAWKAATTGAYVYYNNDPELGKTYGALYNWYVTTDSRGLVSGFHVPGGSEFVTLANFVGANFSGVYLMEKGKTHWLNPRGTDAYGFTALPNGIYGISDVTGTLKFMNLGEIASFWTNGSYGANSDIAQINPSAYSMMDIGTMYPKFKGFGIRMLKN